MKPIPPANAAMQLGRLIGINISGRTSNQNGILETASALAGEIADAKDCTLSQRNLKGLAGLEGNGGTQRPSVRQLRVR